MSTHRFVLEVKSAGTRKWAEMAILASFAKRQSDGMEFILDPPTPKNISPVEEYCEGKPEAFDPLKVKMSGMYDWISEEPPKPDPFADAWCEYQLRLPPSNTVNPRDILLHFQAGWDAAMKYKEGG